MTRFSLFICTCIFLLGCNAKLEREGIPVIGGLRIDSIQACKPSELIQNLEVSDKLDLASWQIEIPMVIRSYQDSESFSYYEAHSLDTLIAMLKDSHIPYTLAFHLQNPFRVGKTQFRPDGYLTDMSGLILRTAKNPPERIVFMGTLLDTTMMGNKFQMFLRQLKKDFVPFNGELIFAARPETLKSPEFDWETPDAVGIIYDPPADLDFKPYFRKVNPSLSTLLIQHKKPALIVQTNLLGKDKLLLFRNQLRFWDKEVVLQGIVLNSIYCEFSLSDTSTYFALGNDLHFQEYLKEYVRRDGP